MEQDREHRNKPMYIWSINFQQRHQEYKMGKDCLFNKLLGKPNIHIQKNETYTIHKINAKWIKN